MKRSFLLSISALALAFCFSSCSTTEFMKRRYMPGHFFNGPITLNTSANDHQGIEKNIPELNSMDRSTVSDEKNVGANTIALSSPLINTITALTLKIKTEGPKTFLKNKAVHFLTQKNSTSTHMGSGGKKRGMGWLSLLFGIFTFYPLLFSSIFCALLAIIFGFITFHRIRKDSSEYGGKGLAFIGMFLGILGVALIALGILVLAAG